MASNFPVLVVIFAGNCGACSKFKTEMWAKVENQLRAEKIPIRIVKIELPRIGAKINTNLYPSDLQNYIQWYPTFLLVPAESWNGAMKTLGATTPLAGTQIMNGRMIAGRLEQGGTTNFQNLNDFMAWVKNALANVQQQQPVKSLVHFTAESVGSKSSSSSMCSMRITSK